MKKGMKNEITLAGYTFKKISEENDFVQYDLQGEFEGAFYLNFYKDDKRLEVSMTMGCSCCSEGSARLEKWVEKLCANKSCRPKDHLCPFDEGDSCVEGIAPIDTIWNTIAEAAQEQFPDWEIEQSA